MKNEAHILLAKHLHELRMIFETEYQFHATRKWRFDFVLARPKGIAIEIEGGLYSCGRHVRGAGYQKDLDKYNCGTAMGWKIYRFSTQDVLRGRAKKFLEEHLS